MSFEIQTKEFGQAIVAGAIPAVSYLSDFALWVTILAGIASFIWACVSIAKALFPRHFNAFVKRIDSKE